MSDYYVTGPAGAALCVWISGGSQSCTTGSGTVTATWSGSTTAVPAIFVESSASALYYNGLGHRHSAGVLDGSVVERNVHRAGIGQRHWQPPAPSPSPEGRRPTATESATATPPARHRCPGLRRGRPRRHTPRTPAAGSRPRPTRSPHPPRPPPPRAR